MAIPANNADVAFYSQLLKGNMAKGIANLERIMQNPQTAEEFANNLGAAQTIFGVGDQNSRELLEVVSKHGWADRTATTWLNTFFDWTYEGLQKMVDDPVAVEAIKSDEMAQAVFAMGAVASGLGSDKIITLDWADSKNISVTVDVQLTSNTGDMLAYEGNNAPYRFAYKAFEEEEFTALTLPGAVRYWTPNATFIQGNILFLSQAAPFSVAKKLKGSLSVVEIPLLSTPTAAVALTGIGTTGDYILTDNGDQSRRYYLAKDSVTPVTITMPNSTSVWSVMVAPNNDVMFYQTNAPFVHRLMRYGTTTLVPITMPDAAARWTPLGSAVGDWLFCQVRYKNMIKRKIIETVEEFDEKGLRTRRTITETVEEDDTPQLIYQTVPVYVGSKPYWWEPTWGGTGSPMPQWCCQ